jgi:toxin ParE1/3/4
LNVRVSRRAAEDLAAATNYLAERNPRAAAALVEDVMTLSEQLAQRAFEGPEQRLRSGLLVRSWPLPPYRLYYRRRDDSLEILRVYHQARRPITK